MSTMQRIAAALLLCAIAASTVPAASAQNRTLLSLSLQYNRLPILCPLIQYRSQYSFGIERDNLALAGACGRALMLLG